MANNQDFCTYEELKQYLCLYGIRTEPQWVEHIKKGLKPVDIPSNLRYHYRKDGFTWKTFHKLISGYVSYEEAKKVVLKHKLKNYHEWRRYCKSGKKPKKIPSNPNKIYKNKDWKGWGDFLGTGNVLNENKVFLSFEKARRFVQSQNFKNVNSWKKYCKSGKKPNNIPSGPHTFYKESWKGYGDWLGTGNVFNGNKVFLSFEKARKFIRAQGIENVKNWNKYCKSGEKPSNIPSDPYKFYKESWKGWGDWLGTDRHCHRSSPFNFVSFKIAKAYAKTQKIKSIKEWRAYCKSGKKPVNIPSSPFTVYKGKGWKGWGDWLGTGAIAPHKREFLSFKEARAFIRLLKLKNQEAWNAYSKSGNRPKNIPSNPHRAYKNKGWTGWEDWLANYKMEYRSFEEARAFVHKLHLKSHIEWRAYVKDKNKPLDIPVCPERVYKDKDWKGWGDWLGTGNVFNGRKTFLPFEEARKLIRAQGIENVKNWNKYCKSGEKPSNIPSSPNHIYKEKGWKGFPDFLGIGDCYPASGA